MKKGIAFLAMVIGLTCMMVMVNTSFNDINKEENARVAIIQQASEMTNAWSSWSSISVKDDKFECRINIYTHKIQIRPEENLNK